MNPTLYQGTGTPYLALFDQQGVPLKEPKTGDYLSSFVTSFQHKLGGENSDDDAQLNVIFQYEDATLLDIPELQAKKIIYFQYGYVFPDGSFICGPAYTMRIMRFDMSLTAQSCTFHMYAKDVTVSLRYHGSFKPNGDPSFTLKTLMDNGFSNGDEAFPIIIKEFAKKEEGS